MQAKQKDKLQIKQISPFSMLVEAGDVNGGFKTFCAWLEMLEFPELPGFGSFSLRNPRHFEDQYRDSDRER